MKNLTRENCECLRRELSLGSEAEALLKCVPDTQVADGLWRLFSSTFPVGGVREWNSCCKWKTEWGLQSIPIYAFGEDIFGNQLVLQPNVENVKLWNHETGNLEDMLLDLPNLLETVCESGIDWIDFYADGSLKIAERRKADVPLECHLHWTTPLMLGGGITIENTSIVERTMHLVGHAKLWRQIKNVPLGTTIVPKK